MTIVLVRAADGGSMLRFSRLQEALRVYDFLMNNFTISAGDDGGRRTRYAELCFPYCETNRPLEVFLVWFVYCNNLKYAIHNRFYSVSLEFITVYTLLLKNFV